MLVLIALAAALWAGDIKLGPLPAATQPREDQLGAHRKLPKEAQTAGKWTKNASGAPLWRAAIRSAGAAAIRVHFTAFDAAAGRVWVYDGKQQPPKDEPFTAKGLYDKGDFWTKAVPGDRVVIEYQPPASSAKRPKTPPFRIAEISHQWRE